MRVRVLSATTPPVVKPKLEEGAEVDLPDEQALAMINAGNAEAVDYEDVGKVERALANPQSRVEHLEKENEQAAEADAIAAAGRLADEEAVVARRVAAAKKAADAKEAAEAASKDAPA